MFIWCRGLSYVGLVGAQAYLRKVHINFVLSCSVPLSACISSTPTRRISVKFGIEGFSENLSGENTGIWLKSDRNVGTLLEDLGAFIVPIDI